MRLTNAERRKYKRMIEGLPTIEIYCKVILGGSARGGISRFPTGFWKGSNPEDEKIGRQRARECTRYLIGTILRWNRGQVCKNLRLSTFNDNYLVGMIRAVYGDSPYQAISDAFPEEDYKPWELKSCPQGYWNEKTGGEAIRWLIEEKMKWTREQVCKNYSFPFLVSEGFSGLLSEKFSEKSPYTLINIAFPGEYKEWEFKSCPQGFWHSLENRKKAVLWLLNKVPNPTKKDFFLNGLRGLLENYFESSVTEAIAFATAA